MLPTRNFLLSLSLFLNIANIFCANNSVLDTPESFSAYAAKQKRYTGLMRIINPDRNSYISDTSTTNINPYKIETIGAPREIEKFFAQVEQLRHIAFGKCGIEAHYDQKLGYSFFLDLLCAFCPLFKMIEDNPHARQTINAGAHCVQVNLAPASSSNCFANLALKWVNPFTRESITFHAIQKIVYCDLMPHHNSHFAPRLGFGTLLLPDIIYARFNPNKSTENVNVNIEKNRLTIYKSLPQKLRHKITQDSFNACLDFLEQACPSLEKDKFAGKAQRSFTKGRANVKSWFWENNCNDYGKNIQDRPYSFGWRAIAAGTLQYLLEKIESKRFEMLSGEQAKIHIPINMQEIYENISLVQKNQEVLNASKQAYYFKKDFSLQPSVF